MKQGKVIKSTGSWYKVDCGDTILDCRIKGKFRVKNIKTTNPVAVGDEVLLKITADEAVIVEILPRKNYLIRKSVNLSKQYHILAANIDQAVLIVSLHRPVTSFEFTDRFLVSCEAYGIPATIVINKIDDLSESEQEDLALFMEVYESVGYPVILTSAEKKLNLAEFKALLKDKTTVLGGHSGVGKSTLINTIQPHLNLTTSEISVAHDQGKHTTTFAELFPLDFGGEIIDTPGIRGLDVADVDVEELGKYFPEFLKLLPQCKFSNCKHVNEPHCAVKHALANELEDVYPSRYRSYLSILEGANEFKMYR